MRAFPSFSDEYIGKPELTINVYKQHPFMSTFCKRSITEFAHQLQPTEMIVLKYAAFHCCNFRVFWSCFHFLRLFFRYSLVLPFVKMFCLLVLTYPMSGLALPRSWLLVQVSVTLFSVTLTTRGVPGIDGNVLGSGVRCRFTLPLFST